MSTNKRQSLIGRDEIAVGSRVIVNNELSGTVKFVGTTSFQTGKWAGIELDDPVGKNSGVVQGKRYFDCKNNHGVFVRPTNIKIINEVSNRTTTPPQRRKSIAPPTATLQRRKSIAPSPSPPVPVPALSQRRKSVAPPPLQRRKSIVPPPPSTQRRKSIIASPSPSPNGIVTKKRPTSLLQSNNTLNSPVTGSKSTAVMTSKRKSIVPQKSTVAPKSTILRKPRSNTISNITPSSILKTRPPMTAPATPESTEVEDEEQTEFDLLCNANTTANSNAQSASPIPAAIISSPISSPISMPVSSPIPSPVSAPMSSPTLITDETFPEQELSTPPQSQPSSEQKPVYGSLASTKPISKSDQTVPLKDYEELRFKLKILETKRHEDRERFREHEKIKEEAEQFLTLRNKLQDKIADLQKDVRDTKRELKEVTNEKDAVDIKYNDLLESMEMLLLDKEVAEERAENLQQETSMLKDKIEEISIDLDILKRETDLMNKPPELYSGNESEGRTPLEIVQLERHNERLKEALLRLRDATADQESELNYKIKTLEHENYELQEIKIQYEKMKENLNMTESLVEDLKMQLDDALGAEDLVDQLTEKNLNLTEKYEELRATVDDLEALKELADELEENHMETEKQLQAEIDHRDMLLREQLDRLRTNEDTLADYEATIQQFRELVTNLQSDLEDLKHKEENQQSEKHTLSSQSQAMMSLNIQLQTTVMKAQAKAIDLELRKLEALQANDRLSMIQPYLPESFFKTENDPISCLLLFKRLEFKSELIIKHLDQNYPISEKIMDNVTESLVTICEMKQRAGWLSSLSIRFQTYIKNSDPDTFSTMGRVYHDLIGVERRMNAIVESFRSDELNENNCLIELQRVISQVEHMADTHLNQVERNNADIFFGLTKGLDLNADRMIVILTFIKQSLNNAVREEGLLLEEGVGLMDQNYIEPLNRLIAQAKNSKIIAKKLMRRLEDMFEEAMTLKHDHLHRFKMLYAISTKLCRFCFDTYKDILAYIDAKRGSHEVLELVVIQKMICERGDEVLEMLESTMWESALRTIKSLTNELETTHAQIERDDKLDKIASKVPPWIQKASDIKAEVVVNHELEHKLQQHNEEIIKLIKDVKMKDQALQESDVKISLMEKRMELAKKEVEQIKTLEDDLEKSLNQEQMYAEAMENLQNEYDALEAENIGLKKEATKREEKRQSLLRKANFDITEEDNSTMQEMAGSYHEMTSQMEALKSSIRYLRAENAQLKSADFVRALDLDSVLEVPSPTKNDHEKIQGYSRETRVLMKDVRLTSASPRVIQLSPHACWQSMKKSADFQYQTQQSVLYTLKQRSLQLKQRVDDLHIIPPSTNNSQISSQPLGLIRIPTIKNRGNHCIDINSAADFNRIHNLFIKT